jgi:hypothetical protein
MKRIDFETLSTVFEFCRDKCNLDVDSGCPVADCPIWQGLEDAGEENVIARVTEWIEEKYFTPGNPMYLHAGIKSNLLEMLRPATDALADASEWLEPTPPQLRQEFDPADDSTADEVGMNPRKPEIQTPDDPDVYKDGGDDNGD